MTDYVKPKTEPHPPPTAQIGRLARVDPKELWAHEAHHFTPWLLRNVDALADELGIDITLNEAEHPIGPFYADLIGVRTHGLVVEELERRKLGIVEFLTAMKPADSA